MALALCAQAAEKVPFHTHDFCTIVDEEGQIATIVGAGEAGDLGPYTSLSIVRDKKWGKSKGAVTLTFEDGTTLDLTQEAQWDYSDPDVLRLTGTFKIVGGTGPFAGAKGGGTVEIVYIGTNDLGQSMFETFQDGTISYDISQ
jgi:hypothetical protein